MKTAMALICHVQHAPTGRQKYARLVCQASAQQALRPALQAIGALASRTNSLKLKSAAMGLMRTVTELTFSVSQMVALLFDQAIASRPAARINSKDAHRQA